MMNSRLLIITCLIVLLSGCSISDWYNGYYAETAAIRRAQKMSDAYYDAESPEKKELRKQNQAYCLELAKRPENRVVETGYKNKVFNQPMYSLCMEERGTPTYGTYVSRQAKKWREEQEARGKRVK